MRLIKITPMTSSLLVNSSATEAYDTWATLTAYAEGNYAVSPDGQRLHVGLPALTAGTVAPTGYTAGTPAVFTLASHGLLGNDTVQVRSSNPTETNWAGTGLVCVVDDPTVYYVGGIDGNTFHLKSSSGSGTELAGAAATGGATLTILKCTRGAVVTDATKWADAGPSNAWALFDKSPATTTSDEGSITIKVNAPLCDAVPIMDMTNVANVTLNAYNGSAVLQHTASFDLNADQTQFYFLPSNASFLPWAGGPLEVVLSDTASGGGGGGGADSSTFMLFF